MHLRIKSAAFTALDAPAHTRWHPPVSYSSPGTQHSPAAQQLEVRLPQLHGVTSLAGRRPTLWRRTSASASGPRAPRQQVPGRHSGGCASQHRWPASGDFLNGGVGEFSASVWRSSDGAFETPVDRPVVVAEGRIGEGALTGGTSGRWASTGPMIAGFEVHARRTGVVALQSGVHPTGLEDDLVGPARGQCRAPSTGATVVHPSGKRQSGRLLGSSEQTPESWPDLSTGCCGRGAV